MILRVMLCLAALALAFPAAAEDADFYRGGWRTASGQPQVYEFVIRGHEVSGIACTRCADGTTLARIEGTFDEKDGIVFTVRHVAADGSLVAADRATAKRGEGGLVVSGRRADGGIFAQTMIKDERGPTPGGYPQVRVLCIDPCAFSPGGIWRRIHRRRARPVGEDFLQSRRSRRAARRL